MNVVSRMPVRVRHQTKLRLVQVARVEQLSPHMRRIVLCGEALDGFVSAAPDDHVKLFFPASGQDMPVLPSAPSGTPAYPDDALRPIMRDYTPRRFDAERRELTIEFVLHGDGPATAWAAQAVAGQWIGVGGPRGSILIPDDYDTYLLAGDETALPAIARFLEEMRPGIRADVLIEVASWQEERHLPTAANASITWLSRDDRPASTSILLEQALRALTLPHGDVHAWLAGEIEVVRRLRDVLVADKALPRTRIRAAGYWRVGEPGAHASLND